MSDSELINQESMDGSEAELTLYKCRLCEGKGKTFTAAERDVHRMQHKNETRKRQRSTTSSEIITLFQPVTSEDHTPSDTMLDPFDESRLNQSAKRPKPSGHKKDRKRRSKKKSVHVDANDIERPGSG